MRINGIQQSFVLADVKTSYGPSDKDGQRVMDTTVVSAGRVVVSREKIRVLIWGKPNNRKTRIWNFFCIKFYYRFLIQNVITEVILIM